MKTQEAPDGCADVLASLAQKSDKASQAKSSQAKPSQVKPSQAKSSQVKSPSTPFHPPPEHIPRYDFLLFMFRIDS
jgi:cell division protein FtsN